MVLCYRSASPVIDGDRYPSERIPDPTIDTSFDDRYRVRREKRVYKYRKAATQGKLAFGLFWLVLFNF